MSTRKRSTWTPAVRRLQMVTSTSWAQPTRQPRGCEAAGHGLPGGAAGNEWPGHAAHPGTDAEGPAGAQRTLKESCDSTEDPEADGCGSDSHPVMTGSSSPSLRPHVERGAGTAACSRSRSKRRGDKRTAYLIYLYRPTWKIRRLILAYWCSCCLWALPAHAWSFPCPAVAVSAALP